MAKVIITLAFWALFQKLTVSVTRETVRTQLQKRLLLRARVRKKRRKR